MTTRRWLPFAALTAGSWGIWGALIELPEKAGFPATLGYAVWALTMLPCALVALWIAGWRWDHDARSVLLGLTAGLLGAGGQLILFEALRAGPAYLVFPIVSLYPLMTVLLSLWLLKERASRRAWAGVVLSFPAIAMLAWQPRSSMESNSAVWLPLVVVVFVGWGAQSFVLKLAQRTMTAESLFCYMAVGAIAVVPGAVAMTDFSKPVEWGFRGPGLAALIQALNSVGALCLVYAVRYGKAMIVVPMTALAPVITILLSLALYRVIPGPVLIVGMLLALIAMYLMAE